MFLIHVETVEKSKFTNDNRGHIEIWYVRRGGTKPEKVQTLSQFYTKY